MEDAVSFLASEYEPSAPEAARFHVVPVPLERSVSYGGGTALGPAAILRASQQLERLVDGVEPGAAGIRTGRAIDCEGDADVVLGRIGDAVLEACSHGALPILLGGEHALTIGAAGALIRERPGRVGVVQFDAHGDLRASYEGDRYSHACAMRPLVEAGAPLCSLGVRALSAEDVEARRRFPVTAYDGELIATTGAPGRLLPADFPPEVYLTFDVDVFDSSLMPATGTPEPGGLGWWQAMRLVRQVAGERRIVAADVVELAPQSHQHACDYLAAKLVHAIMAVSL